MGEITIESIKRNLTAVAEIIRKTEEELDKDGSRFNIFSILNLSTREVRLHSNFISELLDPDGTHSFNTEFLELFLKDLKEHIICNSGTLASFDVSTAKVKVEKWIGYINDDYTRGGKIDLVISDKYENRIFIENKITADDQPKQLLRYYNYNPKALLLYLTLNGNEPSKDSTGGKLTKDIDFYCLSYKEFVLHWLMKCHDTASGKPKVSGTISQYMNIIKDYTSQSPRHDMRKEIISLIKSNKEFYFSIEEINSAFQAFNESISNLFWDKLRQRIPNDKKLMTLTDGADIYYSIDEDGGGFYFGFYVQKNEERVDCLLPEYKPLVTTFKELKYDTYNNHNFICWVFPRSIPMYFSRLGKDKIFDLQAEANMNSLIDQIADEFNQVKDEVIKRLDNIKIVSIMP